MKQIIYILVILFNIYCFFCLRSMSENKGDNGASPDGPISLNVTYETSSRDLEEQRKYGKEFLSYNKAVNQLENKFNQDLKLLKMLLNIQNMELEKLNQVVYANSAVIHEAFTELALNKHK